MDQSDGDAGGEAIVTVVSAALIAAALTVLLWRPGTRRLPLPHGQVERKSPAPTGLSRFRSAIAAGCFLAGVVIIGGVIGVVLGTLAGVVSVKLVIKLDDGGAAARRDLLAAQAPDVADLLAACLASGASLGVATREVAAAVPEPARELFASAAAHVAMGAPPSEAWQAVRAEPATAPIARAVVRSLESGSALADSLSACASELRDVRKAQVEVMARSVAVKAVGPLGLCFLPAFLLLGVVPLVAGLLTRTLGQW